MRVFIAGATGVIGTPLVPLLTAVDHEVVGLARSHARTAELAQAGAEVVVADALDRDALRRAVSAAAPDAVVHLLTAIPAELNTRRLSRDFALTDRLRTEGTRNLLDAAERAGARRVIAQGLAYVYDPHGDGPANEDAPWWREPPAQFAAPLAALREHEALVRRAGGLVLRFGQLYGPGTHYAPDGWFLRSIAAGRVPLVGDGGATFSFTSVHDAASAIVAALDKDVSGALNIVDDEPVPVREWLPAIAELLGAPPPRRIPVALARILAGSWGVAFMTQLRGADNARARLALDWRPRYPSWRDGFAAELQQPAGASVRSRTARTR